jgi:DNA-binding MurR/RpiR family transcriptional regulator
MSTTDPPAVSLQERVAARSAGLSASERKVALYLADHQGDVAFASAVELGQLTGTSDATVIRTVKALGYDGLPGLKRTLHDNIRERIGPAGRLSRSLDVMGSEPEAVLAQALSTSIQLLEEMQRTTRPDSFAEAVKLISAADETLVLGAGPLGVLGEYFTLRLVRLRHRVRSALASGYQVADELLWLHSGAVLVLIVHGKVSAEVDVALDHAAKVGAKIVLITDRLGEALADRVTVTISEPADDTETFTLHAATLTLLDALALAIAAQDREPALEAMSELNQIRDLLRADQRAPQGRRRKSTGHQPRT